MVTKRQWGSIIEINMTLYTDKEGGFDHFRDIQHEKNQIKKTEEELLGIESEPVEETGNTVNMRPPGSEKYRDIDDMLNEAEAQSTDN